MIKEGSPVLGKDIYGENVNGTVTNVLKTFGVAVVKTGNDRLDMTTCHIIDLNVQE